jgi:hypothetical protein
VPAGRISSISLASAAISTTAPVREGDTYFQGGAEYFDDPAAPGDIIWYPRFGTPGNPSGNTIMAAHVNYVGHGDGPFVRLLDARLDDALYVTLATGETLAYTVKSVTLYRLGEIDMDAVVFPPLDSHTERVTLISCGGTFIPAASGYGGEYDSRIVLVAERSL